MKNYDFIFFFRTKRIYLVWFVAGVFSVLFLESLSRSWRTKVGSVHSTKKKYVTQIFKEINYCTHKNESTVITILITNLSKTKPSSNLSQRMPVSNWSSLLVMRSRGADSHSPGQGDDLSAHAEGKRRSWWKVSACVQNQQAGKWKRVNSH